MINCRWCGSLMLEFSSTCPKCGAPNTPEPLPWYKSIVQRGKSSIVSKTKSVWADRLVNFMPIHFLFSLYTFYLGAKIGLVGATGLFTIISSAFSILFVLMYYPDWYEEEPARRKDIGVMYFIFLMAHALVSYYLFF